jgi:hypothetical protein
VDIEDEIRDAAIGVDDLLERCEKEGGEMEDHKFISGSPSAEPLEMKVAAEVQLFPGSRIICVVALATIRKDDITFKAKPTQHYEWRSRRPGQSQPRG